MTRKHVAIADRRDLVRKAAGLGLREIDIASLIGISDKTLRARYPEQLNRGRAEATLRVASRLFNIACGEDKKLALTAQIFWMKCRAGLARVRCGRRQRRCERRRRGRSGQEKTAPYW